MTLNIAVLASTRGTDLQEIIDRIEAKTLTDVKLTCVISNKKDCGAMEKANKHKIEAISINPEEKSREEFDKEIATELEKRNVGLIVLVGYMRYLSPWFVHKYENKIMNIHPSLLPAFAGGMDKNVHKTILDSGVKVTGCTIHFVDEGADTGPIILQKSIPIADDETVDSLKEKVQALEKELYPKAIELFRDSKLEVQGKIVRVKQDI